MAERKDLIQDITEIRASDLLATASQMKGAGFRLGQACATVIDEGVEFLYSFEKNEKLKNIKFTIPGNKLELQSISPIYWAAFIYENEMHDLFGVKFRNLALDYQGHFFRVSEPTPWNPKASPSGSSKESDKKGGEE